MKRVESEQVRAAAWFPLLDYIRSLEFEVVSNTNQLNTLRIEFLFQPSPVVTSLHIVVFIVDGPHNVCSREPPLAVLVIPDGPHLAVVEESYRFLTCHIWVFLESDFAIPTSLSQP